MVLGASSIMSNANLRACQPECSCSHPAPLRGVKFARAPQLRGRAKARARQHIVQVALEDLGLPSSSSSVHYLQDVASVWDITTADDNSKRASSSVAATPLLDRLARLYVADAAAAELRNVQAECSEDDKDLTRRIQAAESLQELEAVLDEHGAAMNTIHLSATLSHLQRLLPWLPPRSSPTRNNANFRSRRSQPAPTPEVQANAEEAQLLQAITRRLEALLMVFLPPQYHHIMVRTADGYRLVSRPLPGASSPSDLDSIMNTSLCSSSDLPVSMQSDHAHHASPTSSLDYDDDLGPSTSSQRSSWQHLLPSQLGPRQLANSIHGLAKARHQPQALWIRRFMEASQRQLELGSFKPCELSMLLWGLAKLRLPADLRPGPQWLLRACQASARISGSCSPQELSTIVWAMATMQLKPPTSWLQRWLVACSFKLYQFKPYDISQTAWALAKLGCRPPTYWMEQLMAAAQGCSSRFKPQDAANLLWALGKIGYAPAHTVVESCLQQLLTTVTTSNAYKPMDLANVLWALAALNLRPGSHAMHHLVTGALRQGRSMNAQDFCNIIWAMAKLRYKPSPSIQQRLRHQLSGHLQQGRLTPQAVPVVLWSHFRLQMHIDQAMLIGLVGATARTAGGLTLQGTAMVLRAFVQYKYKPSPQLLQQLLLGVTDSLAGNSLEASGRRRATQPSSAVEEALQHWVPQAGAAAVANRTTGASTAAPTAAQASSTSDRAEAGGEAEAGRVSTDQSQRSSASPGGVCTPQTVVVILWSVVQLRFKPPDHWTRGLLVHTVQLLPSFNAFELTSLAASLAALQYQPDGLWLAVFSDCIQQRLATLEAKQVQVMLPALTALHARHGISQQAQLLLLQLQAMLDIQQAGQGQQESGSDSGVSSLLPAEVDQDGGAGGQASDSAPGSVGCAGSHGSSHSGSGSRNVTGRGSSIERESSLVVGCLRTESAWSGTHSDGIASPVAVLSRSSQQSTAVSLA